MISPKKFLKNQSKTELRTNLIIIVVCALIGGGLAVAFVKARAPKGGAPLVKTNTKVAEWKEYTNNNEGLTFKYPDTWAIDDLSGDITVVEPYTVEDVNNLPLYGEIRVGVHRGDEKHNFAEWDYDRYFAYITSGGKSEGDDFPAGEIDTDKKQKIKIDGIDAEMVSYRIDSNALYGAFVKHGNNMYNISLTTRREHEKDMVKRYRPLLRKLISTFKFTK